MTRSEYKKLSHDIRKLARDIAEMRGCTTRAELHNVCWWRDNYRIDKYGNYSYCKYYCIGDYDIGLIFGNCTKVHQTKNFIGGKYHES